jgi:hypothetical protein
MTDDRSIERAARSWLEIGPTQAPERAVEAALLQIESTSQERDSHVPWRLPRMTTPLRIAAAAVVGVVAIGGALFVLRPGDSSVGGPGPSPTATPTPSPSPVAGVLWAADGPLAAGTYRIAQWDTACSERQPGCSPSPAHDSVQVTLTVPDGWAGILGTIWLNENAAPDGAGLGVGRGAWLLTDPCTKAEHAIPPDIEVGPSVEDFANALADHPLLDVTDPVDVTLAGYSGKYLDLQVPADISMCEVYRPFDPGIYAQGPGHRWHLWILDVDGLRIVVQGTDYPGTSAKHRAELAAIVDSIKIEP